ncbi:MAG: hypothetical protein COZ06_08005 [Armatimonadetes bacterium CG_4_10_14_3_um_filter_66_18]|nr:MAG: hypothetical protein AUJ96_30570 [Armatimonadetes bacterium CG2_30_66_41]PIU95889.1 MAG: hypothetical protein COS65_00150 [Armatimonadetes bacterium CG06_land_8_20_14_3_00_66_21]PIX47895.1 MAG: hypothetical protein COZ57_07260 [Armatimonadetes bacterium CG_4_8_14_3_um_filter_66_20]PIY50693.1 MAG: hypothetical protein COZ06_08005 [Armatimonadetes bacterium CG_4_10_14_3_um_filter_66_18]PIZ49349.1 MAG: hypothetical protein COY42_04230 [Armatimonadetes bacterium CG_4_10_14_0_8_um_filter_66_
MLTEAREGGHSAAELEGMRDLLAHRLGVLSLDLEALPAGTAERRSLERDVAALRQQVQVLREEVSVTQFVEQSAVAALRMGQLLEG